MGMRLFVVIAICLIAACSSNKPLNEVGDVNRYQRELAKVNTWEMRGRINVRVPGDSDTVSVTWNNQQANYNIYLRGTLGLGATRIIGEPGLVRMEQSGEQPIIARSAEELIYTQFGREIPINDLHFWIRGLPAPQPRPDQLQLATQGVVEQLNQSGWSLHYEDYMAVGPWNMPKKIIAEREDIRLTLLVSKWTLDN